MTKPLERPPNSYPLDRVRPQGLVNMPQRDGDDGTDEDPPPQADHPGLGAALGLKRSCAAAAEPPRT